MKRLPLALIAALAAATAGAIFASAAAADAPVTSHFTVSGSTVLTDVCAFSITEDYSVNATAMFFYDQSGALTRVFVHQSEQDTFSANGHSLTGEPYVSNVEFLYDSNGNLTHLYGEAILERVVLPDGSLFLAAGRVDFVAHPGAASLITPDQGATLNLAGFCAALAP